MINYANISRIDLDLLVVFHCLMMERSVTRTAVILCLSQGAVSAALKRLRELFHDELFSRTSHGMLPTHVALELAPQVALVINAAAALNAGSECFDPYHSRRLFKIALSDDLECMFANIIIHKIIEENYRVGFSFQQTNSHIWLNTMQMHDCDLVICSEPQFFHREYAAEVLFSSTYSCLFDAKQQKTSLLNREEYLACPHIRISYDARRGFIDDIFEAENAERKVVASFTHFSGAMTALIGTDLVATMPSFAAKFYAGITQLTYCPVPLHVPSYRVFMLWPLQNSNTAECIWLKKIIFDIVQEHFV